MTKEKEVTQQIDPKLKVILDRIEKKAKDGSIQKEVEEFKNEIIKIPERPEQMVLSFIPHQMAKVSIFFPMSDRELKEESRIINKMEHKTGWGKVVIEGIKLAIFEEDVFLALLYLAKDSHKKFQDEFILETNINKVVNIMYGLKGYSKRNREVILRTLKHLELVSFDLIIGEWKKKGKERLMTKKIRSIGNIVSGFNYDEDSKSLKIFFNPRFFVYFLESMLTNINFTKRRKLKKDGSKALLRFLAAHNEPGKMHILTVLNAINFNTNQPMFRLRDLMRSFIRELKKNKVLGNKTKLYKDDTVYFDVLPPQKSLPV